MSDSDLAHGSVGKREHGFTNLLPLRANPYNTKLLADLAAAMKSKPDTVKDGADPEENLSVPAGYTYFGQFIDHDLTFDSTSSLDPNSATEASNLRTPRFDLDCVYGDGPDAQPFMYNGAKLIFRNLRSTANLAKQDLQRNKNGRAIIGDKRNDENSIVCQIQLAFIKFHNAVVDKLKNKYSNNSDLFNAARNEVRWTYQKLVIEDFLPRIVQAQVLTGLANMDANPKMARDKRTKNYALYTPEKRGALPLEFVGAAYRFGHSGVRFGYRMNGQTDTVDSSGNIIKKGARFSIFPRSDDADTSKAGELSLLGFDPLPNNQEVDSWKRFFTADLPNTIASLGAKALGDSEVSAVRLQHAYKLDTSMVDPLGVLPRQQVAGEGTTEEAEKLVELPDTVVTPPRPSLALLNLFRGNSYRIAGGQTIAKLLKEKGFKCDELDKDHLSIRTNIEGKDGLFQYLPISPDLQDDTPLWFYILSEAQAHLVDKFGLKTEFNEDKLLVGPEAITQLGWVGGRIVAEVFYGLMDADNESYVSLLANNWNPVFKVTTMLDLLKIAEPTKVS